MKLRTFKGGVHPYEGKELTEHKPIRLLMPVGELVYPLSQHIGAPAKALVAKGDTVLVGQRIGEAGGFISSHIVSGVSGTVKAVEPRRMVNGAKAMSIVVENDGEFRTVEGYGASRDAAAMTKEEIRAAIKDAGIVGLGGAGFPTHVKLTPKDDTKIDYVLVNGAECEPYLTSDYRLMLEEPEALVKGLGIMLR
ncbi:MAG: electron transporter RnfC, partial [Lachnospiraceae bacterium]|nr:electron transporter RnfC [Lachnospiraceae bacterium]